MDTWPIEALWPSQIEPWRRVSVKFSGGNSLTGVESDATSDGGGKWQCGMTIELQDAAQIKLARAMIEATDDGVNALIVPFFNSAEAPYPLGVAPDDVPFSDGATFSDGTLFTSSGITATASAAALRATTLTIDPVAMGALIGGECFSIDHPTMKRRLYTVIRIPGTNQITIRPPLREAIDDDTLLDFGTPGCVMKLVNASDAMGPVTPPYRSTLTVKFIEALSI